MLLLLWVLGNKGEVLLDELNELIAKQKGITVDELSLLDQPKSEATAKADATESKTTKSKK
jgi:hypothetical protein